MGVVTLWEAEGEGEPQPRSSWAWDRRVEELAEVRTDADLHLAGPLAVLRQVVAGEVPDLAALADVEVTDGVRTLRGIPPFGDIPFGAADALDPIPGADLRVRGGPNGDALWELAVRDGRWATSPPDGSAPVVEMTGGWVTWIDLLSGRRRVRDLVREGTLLSGFAGTSILATVTQEEPWPASVEPFVPLLDVLGELLAVSYRRSVPLG